MSVICLECREALPASAFKTKKSGRRWEICRRCYQLSRVRKGLPPTPSGRGVVL